LVLTLSHFSSEIDHVEGLVRIGQLKVALEAADNFVAQYARGKDAEMYWRYHLLRFQVLAYLGQAKPCNALLDNELASEPPILELAVALRILRGSSYRRSVRYRESKEFLYSAVELAHESGLRALEAEGNVRLGFLFYQLERPLQSEEHYRHALQLGSLLGNRYLELIAMAGVARNIMRGGSYAEATNCFCELRRTADELGERLFSAMLACEVGWGHMNQHNYIPALNAFLEAEPVLRDSAVKPLYGICETDIGCVYLKWGSYAVAASYFHRALEVAREVDDFVLQWKSYRNLASAYGKLGDSRNTSTFSEAAEQAKSTLTARSMEVG
jgi:tetratricopeptide (TPR) repeat protein